jgi:hypothetical protein
MVVESEWKDKGNFAVTIKTTWMKRLPHSLNVKGPEKSSSRSLQVTNILPCGNGLMSRVRVGCQSCFSLRTKGQERPFEVTQWTIFGPEIKLKLKRMLRQAESTVL